jgi:putative tryptophan/tyrosine transport system substrate-binding protein
MRRREVIAATIGFASCGSFAARAQLAERIRRIGLLIPVEQHDLESQVHVAAFRQQLQQLGWTEGRNAQLDFRWATDEASRISSFARELVSLRPDAILARSTPVTAALLRETGTIPIVFVNVADPVGAGFVTSMARPGGNATGFTNVEASLGGKWVQVLKELNPKIARLAVMFNPKTAPAGGAFYFRLVEDAARSIGVATIATPVENAADIERVIEAFAREPNGAFVVQPDITIHNQRKLIFSLMALHRLPTIYPYPNFAGEGGLAGYGIDLADVYRRAAGYVNRILRGEKPSDLSVQAPTKFELAINLRTANALGLTIPPFLLARADEVIE